MTDILPYTADGKPLSGVLLFDQDGRPLRVGEQEWWDDGCRRRVHAPVAADGVPVEFSYPQQYVLSGRTLSGELPQPGQCLLDRPRPDVPLPVFPSLGPAVGAVPVPGEAERRREELADTGVTPAPAPPAPVAPPAVPPTP